jgi:hypothetical protein
MRINDYNSFSACVGFSYGNLPISSDYVSVRDLIQQPDKEVILLRNVFPDIHYVAEHTYQQDSISLRSQTGDN